MELQRFFPHYFSLIHHFLAFALFHSRICGFLSLNAKRCSNLFILITEAKFCLLVVGAQFLWDSRYQASVALSGGVPSVLSRIARLFLSSIVCLFFSFFLYSAANLVSFSIFGSISYSLAVIFAILETREIGDK